MEYENNELLKYTIVLGNGFDLSLGFKTKYSHFVESTEWKEMYNRRSKDSKHYSLIQYLNGKRYIEEWFDIESALVDYVSKRKDGSFVNNSEQDKDDYIAICETLGIYFSNHIKSSGQLLETTCAGQLLGHICQDGDWEYRRLYSFNFTPIDFFCERINRFHKPCVCYVHGRIENNTHILGIEVDDIHDIAPGYSFLIKSNNFSYRSSELPSDLIRSQEIILFGHSLNSIDMGYFEEFFKITILS